MTRLALRGLAARRLRTVLTAMAVVLGVAMISGTYVLTDSINRSFERIFAQAGEGTDVAVTAREVSDDFDDSDGPAVALDAALLERVREVPGVAQAAGSVFGQVTIRDAEGEALGGVAPSFASSLAPARFDPFDVVTGRAPRTAGEVALDVDSARDGGYALGDRITVVGEEGARRLVLTGTARFGDVDSLAGAAVAIVPLASAQRLTGRVGELDAILVAAEDGVAPVAARGAVAAALDGEPVTVRTGEQDAQAQSADLEEDFAFLRTALLVFAGIALFVGAFVIYNTFSIMVAQRTRELALLRTLGAGRAQLLRAVVLEAALVGLGASLLGLAAGLAVAPGLRGLLGLFGAELPAEGSVLALRTILVSLGVGVGVTVAASLAPALRATRVAPMAGLREGLTATPRGGRARVAVAAVLSLGGAALLATGLLGGGSGEGVAATMGGGAALVFVGVALLSPQIVRPLAAVVGAPLERVAGLSGRLARENAVRNPGRTAVTASALMVGVALVAFVSIFAAGLQGSIDRSVQRSFAGDLAVTHEDGFSTLPAATAAAVRGVAGVGAVSAVRFSQAKVDGEDATTFVAGIDPATVADAYTLRWEDGSDAVLGRLGDDGVLADANWAADRGRAVGDELSLLTPSGERRTATIRGILDEGGFGLLGGGIAAPNAVLAEHFGADRDGFVFLRFAEGADGTAARARIDRVLARRFPDAQTQDRDEVSEQAAGQIDQVLYLVYALLGLSLLVSLFGIVNTLALSILERTRELGLLRAVGGSRRQVRRIVRLEAVITSLIGAALGVVLGVLFALAIAQPLEEEGFALTFPVSTLLLLLVAAALAGVLAAAWPARRAARLDVLDALAYE